MFPSISKVFACKIIPVLYTYRSKKTVICYGYTKIVNVCNKLVTSEKPPTNSPPDKSHPNKSSPTINPPRIIEEIIAKYVVDANLFRLGIPPIGIYDTEFIENF